MVELQKGAEKSKTNVGKLFPQFLSTAERVKILSPNSSCVQGMARTDASGLQFYSQEMACNEQRHFQGENRDSNLFIFY